MKKPTEKEIIDMEKNMRSYAYSGFLEASRREYLAVADMLKAWQVERKANAERNS